MTSNNAFRMLVSLVAITYHIVPSLAGADSISLTKAINVWTTKTFVSYFAEFTLPPATDVASGIQFYCANEELNFEEIGKAGIIAEVPLDRLKKIVNLWTAANIISPETSKSIDNILNRQNFRTILEAVHVRNDGQIIYATFGFIELVTIGKERTVTALYSLKKFKLLTRPVITSHNSTDACVLWDTFCPVSFKVDGLTDTESRILFSYIRFETLRQFVEKSRQYLENLDKKSLHYRPFLPQSLALAVTRMELNPSKVPTELFSKDPFMISV